MRNKIILLDIDGVLSPLTIVDEKTFTVKIGDDHIIEIPERLINFIKEIKKHTVIWESTWGKYSNDLFKLLNLSDSKYLTYPHTNFNNGIWLKEPAVSYFAKTHPDDSILLLDDDVPSNSKLNDLSNLTILVTNSKLGITSNDEKTINNWLIN